MVKIILVDSEVLTPLTVKIFTGLLKVRYQDELFEFLSIPKALIEIHLEALLLGAMCDDVDETILDECQDVLPRIQFTLTHMLEINPDLVTEITIHPASGFIAFHMEI